MQFCPLCGSRGEQAFVSFSCDGSECVNYVRPPPTPDDVARLANTVSWEAACQLEGVGIEDWETRINGRWQRMSPLSGVGWPGVEETRWRQPGR